MQDVRDESEGRTEMAAGGNMAPGADAHACETTQKERTKWRQGTRNSTGHPQIRFIDKKLQLVRNDVMPTE